MEVNIAHIRKNLWAQGGHRLTHLKTFRCRSFTNCSKSFGPREETRVDSGLSLGLGGTLEIKPLTLNLNHTQEKEILTIQKFNPLLRILNEIFKLNHFLKI